MVNAKKYGMHGDLPPEMEAIIDEYTNIDFDEAMKVLPSEEGDYKMTDFQGNCEVVKIENMAISKVHPPNLFVLTDNDYYSLSIENGCHEFFWEKIE